MELVFLRLGLTLRQGAQARPRPLFPGSRPSSVLERWATRVRTALRNCCMSPMAPGRAWAKKPKAAARAEIRPSSQREFLSRARKQAVFDTLQHPASLGAPFQLSG